MRKITLFFAFLLMLSTTTSAATGWFSDYVKLNVNGAGESFYWIGSDPSFGTQLQGAALGSVSSLVITGCDMKYWSDSQDRTGGSFYYKVTNTTGTVDYIASTEVIWDQTYSGGNDYQGLKSTSIDLLAGLPYGTRDYKLQVWSKSWGSNQGDSYLSNDGANYVATFSYTKTNPTTFSGTYKVGESTGTNFTSLSAAVSAINAGTIAENVVLEIMSNITEATDISLGINTGSKILTIKPAIGVTPTITFQNTGASVSIDGHFVIGSPSASSTNLISTNNIVIDGSNTVDGTTKDLTIIGSASSVARSVFRIYGNCDGVIIKNCIIITKNTSATSNACIQLTDYTTLAPDNFTAQNNTLNANSGNGSLGAMISVSGTPTALMTGIKIQNNIVVSRATRAIMFNYVADGEISGNSITHDLQLSTGAAQTIAVMTGGSGVAGTFNIFNNKITQVKTWNTAVGPTASNGAIGIDNQLASPKIVNIYNNFITGFTISSASVQGVKIYGIRHVGGSTSNVYNNTIVIPEMTDMTTTTGSFIAGIAFATAATTEAAPSGTMTVKDNIIISNETGMKTWGIRRVGTGGTFTSNNNNIYHVNNTFGFVGYYSASDASDLATWKTASSQDGASISKNVSFVSTSDLSLTGTSINDVSLGVPRIATVLTDILGTNRGATTYMGAHEAGAIVASSLNASDISIADNGNVAVTKTGFLTFDGNKSVGSLSIEGGGKVTLADTKSLSVTNLTIKSIADSTGTFVNENETGGLTISGTKSVQQYLASSRNWYMSSPINDAKALSGYTYYQYNEPDGSLGTNWTSLNVGDDLTVGKGYIIKPAATDTYNFSTISGTLNDGNIPVTIYRTDGVNKAGFNLVGNPYPSYINVDNLVNTNVEASYWVRTRNAAQTAWVFDTYNIPSALSTGGSGKSVTKMISPMQAFWLRVKSTETQATLAFTNGLRGHKDDVNNNFRAPAVKSQSVLRLSVTDGINNDETLVYFNTNASNAFDAYDSHKMINGVSSVVPDMYTMAGSEELVINGMSTIPAEIPLYIKPNASTSGQFSLTATEVSNFEAGTQVFIKNSKTGQQQLISDGSVYSFDITANPLLSIIIKAPGAVTGLNNNPTYTMNVYANAKGQMTVVMPAVNAGDVARVFNSAGQCILNQSLTNSRTMLNKFFTAGVYVVKVNETIRKVVIE